MNNRLTWMAVLAGGGNERESGRFNSRLRLFVASDSRDPRSNKNSGVNVSDACFPRGSSFSARPRHFGRGAQLLDRL